MLQHYEPILQISAPSPKPLPPGQMARTGAALIAAALMAAALMAASSASAEAEEGLGLGVGRRMHTLFSVECQDYFDWQTVGLVHSLRKAGHPGPLTRLLSCSAADLRSYRGIRLAPTLLVPSMSRHPRTGDWSPSPPPPPPRKSVHCEMTIT